MNLEVGGDTAQLPFLLFGIAVLYKRQIFKWEYAVLGCTKAHP